MADKKVVRESLKAAGLKKGDIFYDLGCGKGDVLIEAEKMGAKVFGCEISPYYYILAKIRTSKHKNIKVIYQNIENINLSDANIVYCYLLPKFLEKLSPKFLKELELGCQIISIGFPISRVPRAEARDSFFSRWKKFHPRSKERGIALENKIKNSKKIRINGHNIYLYVIQ